MNVLFLISGFFYKVRKINTRKERINLVKQKAERLLIPYIFCMIISIILKLFLSDYAKNPLNIKMIPINLLLGLDNPNGGICFLYTLFILSFIAVLLYKVDIKVILGISILLKICSLEQMNLFNMPVLSLVSNYAIYYFFGIYIFNQYGNIKSKVEKINTKSIVIVIEFIVTIIVSYINIYYLKNSYLNFLLSVVLIYISYKLAITMKDNKFINLCGQYGMAIYRVGYYIQQTIYVIMAKILGISYSIYWIFMFAITIMASILINKYIIQKISLMKLLVLGEK